MPAPEEYRCAACGGDLRAGHESPCVKCGRLWEPNELDSRGVCPVCDGQLGLQYPERPDARSAYRLPPLGDTVPSFGGNEGELRRRRRPEDNA